MKMLILAALVCIVLPACAQIPWDNSSDPIPPARPSPFGESGAGSSGRFEQGSSTPDAAAGNSTPAQ